ncbi:hypothetical protein FOG51_02649 [Hanseniaspora uvarum]|nr:hypothetical protein FOG48_02709 [Hanseniaspora uvarum]KAF0272495.1 hypothetical protein FOG51_02649 [Hanseniaspora uvarum]KAF0276526.1 hypothetical protein FOG50_02657 [Hanseniaspora uvarum]
MTIVYKGSLCLAPMVRAGSLPTRLLALSHGVDLVWSPEIIDKKIVQCTRVVNTKTNTIDYLAPIPENRKHIPDTLPELVFRTDMQGREKGKLIFQVGTSDPELAVQAALKVIDDVDGIDVNSGCPKPFSVHSGCGAALLRTPDILVDILTNLVNRVGSPNNKPISVKIRILENEEITLDLVSKILKTGISNLTVHCRTPSMRNRESPIRAYIPKIYELCKQHGVSLILNGGLENKLDFLKVREELGLDEEVGGMFADQAEVNPTIFLDKPLEWNDVLVNYLKIARSVDNSIHNTKYMLSRILKAEKRYSAFSSVKSHEEIEDIMNRFYNYDTKEFDTKGAIKYSVELRQHQKAEKVRKQREEQLKKNEEERASKKAKNQSLNKRTNEDTSSSSAKKQKV